MKIILIVLITIFAFIIKATLDDKKHNNASWSDTHYTGVNDFFSYRFMIIYFVLMLLGLIYALLFKL